MDEQNEIVKKFSYSIGNKEWLDLREQYKKGFSASSARMKKFNISDSKVNINLENLNKSKSVSGSKSYKAKFESRNKDTDTFERTLYSIAAISNIIHTSYGGGYDKQIIINWATETSINYPWTAVTENVNGANKKTMTKAGNKYKVNLSTKPFAHPKMNGEPLTLFQLYDIFTGEVFINSILCHSLGLEEFSFCALLNSPSRHYYSINFDADEGRARLYNTTNNQYDVVVVGQNPVMMPTQIPEEFNTLPDQYNLVLSKLYGVVELITAERALLDKYYGAVPYVFAYREYYTDSEWAKDLEKESQKVNKQTKWLVAFLNLFCRIMHPDIKLNINPYFEYFIMAVMPLISIDFKTTGTNRFVDTVAAVVYGNYWLYQEEPDDQMDMKDDEQIEMLFIIIQEISIPIDIGNSVMKQGTAGGIAPPDVEVDIRDTLAQQMYYLNAIAKTRQLNEANPNSHAEERWTEIENKHQGYIQDIQEQIKVLSYAQTSKVYARKSGHIDENSLWKCFDPKEENVFYQSEEYKLNDGARIHIVVDTSSSMSSSDRITKAAEMGVVLASALKDLPGISLYLYTFNCGDVVQYIHQSLYSYSLIQATGGTNEGSSIAVVIKHILNAKNMVDDNYDNYMFVLGDGQVDQDESREAFRLAVENGIKTYHLGLDEAYTEQYGKDTYGKDRYCLINSDDCMAHLAAIVVSILLNS